jgi:hypothetical protein
MICHDTARGVGNFLRVIKKNWVGCQHKFDFEIIHIKGKENRVADALRRSMKTVHLAVVSTCETDVKERIRNAQETDPFV